MTKPNFVTQFLEQPFEPGTVATSFQADDHPAAERGVKSPHRFFVLVFQFAGDEFTSFSCQITERLLSCMKVNANIYSFHSASFQSPSRAPRVYLTAGGAGFITSLPVCLVCSLWAFQKLRDAEFNRCATLDRERCRR